MVRFQSSEGLTPFSRERISEHTDSAISSGESAPIWRPIGHLTESTIFFSIPAPVADLLKALHLDLEPIAPILGLFEIPLFFRI
ncbi:MAG: hypothetical protein CMA79_04830 [Euryarchaeota archaeon]|nr:hypothetical protein [Euryarchaeota archaeon]